MVRNCNETIGFRMQEMNMATCLTYRFVAKTGKDFNYFKS